MQNLIAAAWADRELLKDEKYIQAIRDTIEEVDKGRLRTAEPVGNEWQVNEWVKQAILLYFGIQQMETFVLPPFEFYDKMKLKSDYKSLGVRAVPHGDTRDAQQRVCRNARRRHGRSHCAHVRNS